MYTYLSLMHNPSHFNWSLGMSRFVTPLAIQRILIELKGVIMFHIKLMLIN